MFIAWPDKSRTNTDLNCQALLVGVVELYKKNFTES